MLRQHLITPSLSTRNVSTETFVQPLLLVMVMLIPHGMKILRDSSLLLTKRDMNLREPRLLKLFPFRAGSPLLHQWHIQDLLPVNCTTQKSGSCGTPFAVIYFAVIRQSPIDIIRGAFPSHLRLEIWYFVKTILSVMPPARFLLNCPPGGVVLFSLTVVLTPVTARLIDPASGDFVIRAHLRRLKFITDKSIGHCKFRMYLM
jgi:hypothetical protein